MKLRFTLAVSCVLLLLAGCAATMRQPQPQPTQSVSFIEPANDAVVVSPFMVKFGLSGMEVAPAGVIAPNSGHHHLLINADPIAAGQAIPIDEHHLHFGKGQTETMVTLPPGRYKLTMQFANGAHQSYGPALSKTIMVTVK